MTAMIMATGGMLTVSTSARADAAPQANAALELSSAVPEIALAAAPTQMTAFDQQMIKLVNAKRVAAGLVALQEAKGLTQLSVYWSGQMADGATGYVLKHNPSATSQLSNYGASNWGFWAENVARWNPPSISAQAIFDSYWASPGHKANIMAPKARYIGMGSVAGSSGWAFNTMTFTDKVESGQAVTAPASYPSRGRIDKVGKANGTFTFAGWAYSTVRPGSSNTVRVTVSNPQKTVTYLKATPSLRSDVNRIYGITGNHGFTSNVPLLPGNNKICFTSIAFPGGTSGSLGCYSVKGL